ncbi:MAG: hypothetical protein JXB49_07065 [Bacteroidales bacterium]|nr:hypothetical protein [Bacteroidales bacterium]
MKKYIFIVLLCLFSHGYTQEFESTSKESKDYAVLIGLNSGIWIPAGKLGDLGVHPLTGFKMDIKWGKMYYGLGMDFRFMKAKNHYDFYYSNTDTIVLTNCFFSGSYGIHLGRDIIAGENYNMVLNLGIAYDYIKAVNEPDDVHYYYGTTAISEIEKKDMVKYLHSYNIGLSIINRYSFNNKTYMELGACYNITDFTLQNRSNLTGNVFTITFTYGLNVSD